MPRDGSGSYSRVAGTPYVFNTVIDQDVVNDEMDDIGTALTNSIAKDGQTVTTSAIPFASGIQTDTIAEKTAATGVTIDSVLLKDGTVTESSGNVLKPTLGTEQASTSGTSIDFTGIPSWAKKITVMLDGVSTNGTSNPLLQIGDSGGVEATGYVGGATVLQNASAVTVTDSTAGFQILGGAGTDAGDTISGSACLTLMDTSNTWVCVGNIVRISGGSTIQIHISVGVKATSATLDRVRVTTAGGTDTFDAGAINIQYE